MLFNSPVFLFVFLPLLFLIYFSSPKTINNLILLIASLIFYSWGQADFILILLIMVLVNYLLSLSIEKNLRKRATAKKYLLVSILLNLLLLSYFKYRIFILANLLQMFEVEQLPTTLIQIFNLDLPLMPLAISFFIFHAISYNVDVFRGESKAEKSLLKLSLYFLFFPHLLAGPILRYHQIQKQLITRKVFLERFAGAIRRFSIGFAKKVLIADQLGVVVNEIFAISPNNLNSAEAWLGIICFTLQIYFDFSAYTDMAIGLAKMFGFDFPENFNYPYISSSIREFWRRWHMTLSNWLRDYVYIPLGGNRVSGKRIYLNLFIVFLVTGIWHGAGWNFIIWGLIHGIFMILERIRGGILVNWIWKPFRHFYAMFVVIISWVFFRAENLEYAVSYIRLLFGFGEKGYIQYRPLEYFLTNEIQVILLIAIIISLPVYPKLINFIERIKARRYFVVPVELGKVVYLVLLLLLSISVVAAQTYRSFLYFKF